MNYWHDKHARQYMANVAQRKKGAVAILLRANITFRRKRRKLTYTSPRRRDAVVMPTRARICGLYIESVESVDIQQSVPSMRGRSRGLYE